MADVMTRGFQRDESTFQLVVDVVSTTGQWQTGFLRNSAGELIVTFTTTGARWQTGFLRAPSGALVVTSATTGLRWQNGFLRSASDGALVINLVPNLGDAKTQTGFLRCGGTEVGLACAF